MSGSKAAIDTARFRPGLFHGIGWKLAIWFSLLFALILAVMETVHAVGVPFTSYAGTLGQRRAETFASLNQIADLKKKRLERWLEERRADAVWASQNKDVEGDVARLRRALRRLPAGLPPAAVAGGLREAGSYATLSDLLSTLKTSHGIYERIFVAEAPSGTVLASTDPAEAGTDASRHPAFAGVLASRSEFISNMEISSRSGHPVFFLSHVIREIDLQTREERTDQLAAVMVLAIDARDEIEPMLEGSEGMGASDEALLVDQDARLLTALEHPLPGGAPAEPLKSRLATQAAVLAASGKEGILEGMDYRGVPVLAAYRHIRITPQLGWGLIVKRDRAHLLGPWRQEVMHSLWISLIGLLAIIGLTVVLARTLTHPIRALSQAADRVARGDLGVRAPIASSDEVGALARTFNAMVEHVQKAQEELVRKERLAVLGQLTATVSHEIRNPLGTIRSSIFSIGEAMRRNETARVERAVTLAERNIVRCDRIIEELSDFIRVRAVESESADVDGWLGEVLDETEPPPGIALTRQLHAGVWVELDRERLRRAVVNVLTNAVQALQSEESTEKNVTVETRVVGARLEIRVADNGPGIPPDALARLFEPLFSTKSFGLGLGLCIVKQIMEQHGGGVEIQSRLGQGTTLTLWLPMERRTAGGG